MSQFNHTHLPVLEANASDNPTQIDHYLLKGDPVSTNFYKYFVEIHPKPGFRYHSCVMETSNPGFSNKVHIVTYPDPIAPPDAASIELGDAEFLVGAGHPNVDFEFTTYEADSQSDASFIKSNLELDLNSAVVQPKKKRKQQVNFTVNPNSTDGGKRDKNIWKKLFKFLRGLFKK